MDLMVYVTELFLFLGSLRNQVIWGRGACHPEQKMGMLVRKKNKMANGRCQSPDWNHSLEPWTTSPEHVWILLQRSGFLLQLES